MCKYGSDEYNVKQAIMDEYTKHLVKQYSGGFLNYKLMHNEDIINDKIASRAKELGLWPQCRIVAS